MIRVPSPRMNSQDEFRLWGSFQFKFPPDVVGQQGITGAAVHQETNVSFFAIGPSGCAIDISDRYQFSYPSYRKSWGRASSNPRATMIRPTTNATMSSNVLGFR